MTLIHLLVTVLLSVVFPGAETSGEPAAQQGSTTPTLDYDFYKARVEPLFLEKRPGHARCVTCHAGSATLRLQRFAEGSRSWSEGAWSTLAAARA